MMGWEAPMLEVMLEFFNTFLIKDVDIYFGHKDKVYVINKQLTVDVFGVCVEGYVEESKGHVSESLTVQALQSCRLTPVNFSISMECKKVWVCHTLSDILPLYLSFIKGRRYSILTTKMLLHY
jgi:hypothetical protein